MFTRKKNKDGKVDPLFEVTIEEISTEKRVKYTISAPDGQSAYKWGQKQGDQRFGDDRGLIEVREVKRDG